MALGDRMSGILGMINDFQANSPENTMRTPMSPVAPEFAGMRQAPPAMPERQMAPMIDAPMAQPSQPAPQYAGFGDGGVDPKKAEMASQVVEQVKANPQIAQDPSFGDKVKSFFGNEENMLNLAMAFNTMRMNPDQGLASHLSGRLKTIGDTKAATEGRNKTMAYLQANFPEIHKMVASGMPIKEAMALINPGAKSTMGKLAADLKSGLITQGQYASEVERMKTAGSTTINMGGEGKASDELFKLGAQQIATEAALVPQLQSQLSNLSLLSRLGEVMDTTTEVPGFFRPLIEGKGISRSLDAYGSILKTTAQSLRVAGSGPMTDKDFEILLQRAGSISSSPEARRIAQQALQRAGEIGMARGLAAQQYLRNPEAPGAREAYYARIDEINAMPLLSDDQRTFIQQLTGDAKAEPTDSAGGFTVTGVRETGSENGGGE